MDIREQYDEQTNKKIRCISLLFILMTMISIYTVTVGTADVSVHEVLSAINKVLTNGSLTMQEKIIWYLRIPRIFMAILAGAGLSFAGTGLTPETLILTGIALNYLFSAFTATIHFFAQEHQLASKKSIF